MIRKRYTANCVARGGLNMVAVFWRNQHNWIVGDPLTAINIWLALGTWVIHLADGPMHVGLFS